MAELMSIMNKWKSINLEFMQKEGGKKKGSVIMKVCKRQYLGSYLFNPTFDYRHFHMITMLAESKDRGKCVGK